MTQAPKRPGKNGPVMIEIEDTPPAGPRQPPSAARHDTRHDTGADPANPADAAPIEDLPQATQDRLEGRAMQIAARLGARPASPISKFFWRSLIALIGFLASLAAWRFIEGLFAATPILGWVGAALLAAVVLGALLMTLREIAAFSRLKRLDGLHREISDISGGHDLRQTRKVVSKLTALYAARPDMAWSRSRLAERGAEEIDSDTLIEMAETELMGPLDQAARLEIEAASRTVATTTALVPLALADVATAMIANVRMIRRIAEIYGGRSGAIGALRLTRAVMTHLVATGAVAAGDDLIETVAGGHLAAKLSRRFGEGVVNGALTARVGVAAMEVCRPMPFRALARPRVTNLTRRALTGLFGRGKADGVADP